MDNTNTIETAQAAGFKQSGTGAVRAIREIGYSGDDYTTWNRGDLYLRIYADGSWRMALLNGERKTGESGYTLRWALEAL